MLQRICFLIACAKYITYFCILYKSLKDDLGKIYANASRPHNTLTLPHVSKSPWKQVGQKGHSGRTQDTARPAYGLIRSGTLCCKLWQTFLCIFNPPPRASAQTELHLWSTSRGGLSQDQDASYRAALCCLSEGRRLRGFPLILCWRIWEGPLLMIMMLRPNAEIQAGARPRSRTNFYIQAKSKAGLWRVERDKRI